MNHNISVVILTRNEERNLPECLASVAWCNDVVVLDSFSTDRTVAIARHHGARVVQREFTNFADQRNFAAECIPFRNPWLFHLDADERFTLDLLDACLAAAAEDVYSGYLVPSKTMLFGRWLKHAAEYPVYQMRFLKIGEIAFEQYGHGQRECGARRGIGVLPEPYLHYAFSTGFARWFEKHNVYSGCEVKVRMNAGGYPLRKILSANPVERRRALKANAGRLPCRPLLRFAYLYLLRGGFLDGRAGLTYSALQSVYEYMIDLKCFELRHTPTEVNDEQPSCASVGAL